MLTVAEAGDVRHFKISNLQRFTDVHDATRKESNSQRTLYVLAKSVNKTDPLLRLYFQTWASFSFPPSENSHGIKGGGGCNSKGFEMLPYCIPFQWLSFDKLVPDPTTLRAPRPSL